MSVNYIGSCFGLVCYWCINYVLLKYFTNNVFRLFGVFPKIDTKVYIYSCAVSLLHSLTTLMLITYITLNYPQERTDYYEIDDNIYGFSVLYTVSYMIFDTMYSYFTGMMRRDDIIHHGVGISALAYILIFNDGVYVAFLFQWTELSTPFFIIFLVLKRLLKEKSVTNQYVESIYQKVRIMFGLMFFFCRVCYLSYWFVILIPMTYLLSHYIKLTLFAMMYGLNMYWFSLMVKNIIKRGSND